MGSVLRMTTRFTAQVRHQTILIARDPGPLIGYTVMPLLLIVVLRPMFGALAGPHPALGGTAQATCGMAVMFALFALKTVGSMLLDERTWHTWDRVRASPARFGEILAAKALPMFCALLVQQTILFAFAIAVFGLTPAASWWPVVVVVVVWSACILVLGTAAATLLRSPAQLSAAGDVFALMTTILAGALVPTFLLVGWLRAAGPISPGYWALRGYHAALSGAALAEPLAMLGAFAALGVVATVAVGRRQSRT
jgi:ABC-2 type transport system permease protein